MCAGLKKNCFGVVVFLYVLLLPFLFLPSPDILYNIKLVLIVVPTRTGNGK